VSNKICYKCAYELDQCTKFVQKYKKSRTALKPIDRTLKPQCFLCYELVDSDRIFDITNDTNLVFNPLQKIRSIFNDDVSKKDEGSKLICLTCRYNLDVLFDLKRIYQETIVNLKALINEEINYSNFPKVHTDVVNRKTTITTFPDITIYGTVNSSDSESIEEVMTRGKRRVRGRKSRSNMQIKLQKNKLKVRNCDKCNNAVANGIDMYRFYHTGLTVCKNCWITIDPSSDKTRRSRQTRSNFAGTKLCTVFLTDILSQESYRKNKIDTIEKDKDNNMSYSSQEETKSSESSHSSVSSRTRNHRVNGKARRGRKRQIKMEDLKDIERTSKMIRLNKERTNANETLTKASVDEEQQSSVSLTRGRGRKRIVHISSDSDGSLEQKVIRKNDSENEPNRKKLKSSLRRTSTRYSSDEISNEDDITQRSETKDATSTSTTPTKKGERAIRSRTNSSSMSSTEITLSTEFKSPKLLTQSEIKTEYACDKCNKIFDTKLSNAKHRLTHLKQAALKLEKLSVSSIKEKQETEVESQDDKISKEEAPSHSDKTKSADKQTHDPSEDIAINIEDDTDDEDIFSLSAGEKIKEKVTKDISDDVIDKSDAAKNESRVEEPANDENIEMEKSEQCEKSTVLPDEILEIENNEDGKNEEDARDEHTTKDEDNTLTNRDSDKSTDKDTQKNITDTTTVEDHNADDDVNVELENHEKVPSMEKENSISECNNDKENLHEETMCDSEAVKSLIVSIHNTIENNKDHSESCINNLENNGEDNKDDNKEDDKDDTIEEPQESSQCDLMDESSQKDTKEPEEKVQEDMLTEGETEKTKINDEKDLDDTVVMNEDKIEELEKQQNSCNEENVEVNIIGKSINVKDTIMADFSNGEKHDEIEDRSEKNDVDAILVNNDSNDIEKCKKITEELTLIDDSKEKSKLEEEIKELEELVDDNAINNKREKVQENSTYDLDNSSTDAANEILKEVFELAANEVQQREESDIVKNSDNVEMETLENISREIRKSADMPSLDPISIMDLDDDDITLN